MMGIDDGGERSGVIFLAQTPIVRPGQLRIGDALGGVGHALEPEVGRICEDGRQQRVVVPVGPSTAKIGEIRQEACPACNFVEQFGDADPGQDVVDHPVKPLGFGRRDRL